MKIKFLVMAFFIAGTLIHAIYEPRFLFYARNPWLSVIGSDSPAFALYDDGTIIFWKQESKQKGEYKTIKLSKSEIDELFGSLLDRVEKLDEHYSLTLVTDQITNDFLIFSKGKQTRISVYGDIDSKAFEEKKLPDDLLKLYKRLVDCVSTKATTWHPEFIEVMVWPYDYAPEESILWPKNWPGLKSRYAFRRSESYSIFIPFGEKDTLINVLKSRKEKGAIIIGGKKWAIDSRLPFPHEPNVRKLTP